MYHMFHYICHCMSFECIVQCGPLHLLQCVSLHLLALHLLALCYSVWPSAVWSCTCSVLQCVEPLLVGQYPAFRHISFVCLSV